jgi:hypothetical protein
MSGESINVRQRLGVQDLLAEHLLEFKSRMSNWVMSSGVIFCVITDKVDSLNQTLSRLETNGHAFSDSRLIAENLSTRPNVENLYNEIAWRYPLATLPHDKRAILFIGSNASKLHFTKIGFTTVIVGPKNVPYHVNLKLESFVDIEKYMTRDVYYFGSYNNDSITSEPLDIIHLRRRFGNYVRNKCLSGYLNYHHSSSRRLVMLGSEVESVDIATRMGIKEVLHFGIVDNLIKYSDVQDVEGDVPDVEGDGQRKLFAVDFPFLSMAETVIAIGGAPGDHFGRSDNIISVDPRPMHPDFFGIHFKDYFSSHMWNTLFPPVIRDKSYVVLMDIRPDREIGMTDLDWETIILENNKLMFSWYKDIFLKDPKCFGVSIKFRPPRYRVLGNDKLKRYRVPRGDIILQPYVWSRSSETRLFFDLRINRDSSMMIVDQDEYFDTLLNWNRMRFQNKDIENKQEKAIAEWCILKYNYLDFDFSVFGSIYIISLFSLSNFINPKKKVISFIKSLDNALYDIILPLKFNNFPIKYGKLVTYKDKLVDGDFEDHTYSPCDMFGTDGYCFSMSELELLRSLDYSSLDFEVSQWDVGFEGNHPLMKVWFFFTNNVPFNVNFQSVMNSQTHLAKPITALMRMVFKHDDDTLIDFRRDIIAELGGEVIHDRRVNGILWNYRKTKKVVVAVSGHMIGLLLWYTVGGGLVDFKRYLHTIEMNVKFKQGVNSKSETFIFKDLKKQSLLMEQFASGDLWHSYMDWHVGVLTFIRMCEYFGFEYEKELVDCVEGFLERLVKQYSVFDHQGWQALEYLKGKENVF